MSKRSKLKYPNLDKSVNTKSRSDFIETDYIDGVKNADGELVIRPMNDKEKAWLNQWYGEHVIASSKNLNPTPEIQEYSDKKSQLKKDIAKERKDKKVKTSKKIKFMQNKIIEIEECLDFLREEAGVFYPKSEDQREIFRENNHRNACIYNNLKSRGMLLELTEETYDIFIGEYWEALAAITGEDSQDKLIRDVEDKLRGTFLPHKLTDPDDESNDS